MRLAGWTLIETERGRAIQINAGVAAAEGPFVCVLHADSIPPGDMVAVICKTLEDQRTALAGFTPLICGPGRVRWGTSFHNWIKTWYAPLLMRPHLFMRGVRLLFGDHAMFFRRADFLAVGGCDPGHARDGGGGSVHPHGAARESASDPADRAHVRPADRRMGCAESQLDLFKGRHDVGFRRAQAAGTPLSRCALNSWHDEAAFDAIGN